LFGKIVSAFTRFCVFGPRLLHLCIDFLGDAKFLVETTDHFVFAQERIYAFIILVDLLFHLGRRTTLGPQNRGDHQNHDQDKRRSEYQPFHTPSKDSLEPKSSTEINHTPTVISYVMASFTDQ